MSYRGTRSRTRSALAVPLLAVLAVVAAACGNDDDTAASDTAVDTTVAVVETTAPADTTGTTDTTAGSASGSITIGGFGFSESSILALIYEGALDEAGVDADVRLNLGNREIVGPALESGEIDLVPEYAATALEFWNKGAGEASGDATATVAKLNERLAPLGLTALVPSPAADQNAFAVTKATADQYSLTSMSDLAEIADELTLGGPPECPERPFCIQGLKDTYGIEFGEFRPLDAGGPLTKAALENGDIDVGLVFSSDGAIPAKGFVVLADDKQLQNADNIVPVGRTDKLTAEVAAVLDKVSAALTTEELAEMNKRADLDKEDPEELAEEWLQGKGLGG